MKKTKMLKKNYEFKYVLSKGKYFSGKYIEAFIKEKEQKDDIKKGYRIVLLWKKKANTENATFQKIKEDMYYIFDKANLIKEENK